MRKLELYEHKTSGLLFSFCGLDGCGKSTMIAMLSEYFTKRNAEIFLTKQPTDFMRNSAIFRTYMDQPDHEAYDYRSLSLLAAGDRIQHSNKVILPELKNGKYVISDRYFYSCIANLRARGYAEDEWIYEIARHIPKPDLAFFLDVPVETAIKRVRNRIAEKDRYIDMELQYRLREEYIKICRAIGGVLISTEDPEEQCYSIIKQTVERIGY